MPVARFEVTRLKRILLGLALLGVVALGLLVGVDNHTVVALRFLDWQTAALPMFWWLYAAFLGGVLLGCALCGTAIARAKLRERRLRRTLAARDGP